MKQLDVEHEIARLSEQNVSLLRELDRLHNYMQARFLDAAALTDAKFVTFETLVTAGEKQVALALSASDMATAKQEVVTATAITKQEMANDKRFESVNEFRQQLGDLIARFATLERVDLLFQQLTAQLTDYRKEADARMGRMEKALGEVQVWQGNITGRLAVGGLIFVVVMAAITFLANYLTRAH